LLRDIDLDGGPRPQQLPYLRQRFDGGEEPALGSILPLRDPAFLSRESLGNRLHSPDIRLVNLKPAAPLDPAPAKAWIAAHEAAVHFPDVQAQREIERWLLGYREALPRFYELVTEAEEC
jgi:hypothetical protein